MKKVGNYEGNNLEGWLLFFLLQMVGILLRSSINIMNSSYKVYEYYSGSLVIKEQSTEIVLYLVLNILSSISIITFGGYCLWLMLQYDKRFPKIIGIFLIVNAMLYLIQGVFLLILGSGTGDFVQVLISAIVGNGIWILYFRESNRVKATFGCNGLFA